MAVLRVPIGPSDHVLGDAGAAVTLVEYGDYQCPHCAAAHPVVRRVHSHFGGQLAFVFRHFPLTEIHPLAGPAAESAEFAGTYGRFWQMHDGIYENQADLGLPLLLALVRALDLSEQGLLDALASNSPKVQADFLGGVRSGVNGTPTFFIDGQRHDAPFDFPTLVAAIDAKVP